MPIMNAGSKDVLRAKAFNTKNEQLLRRIDKGTPKMSVKTSEEVYHQYLKKRRDKQERARKRGVQEVEHRKKLEKLRRKEKYTMVHLINLTGGRRFFRQTIPLQDVEIILREKSIAEALLLSSGEKLPIEKTEKGLRVRVNNLKDYDVVVFRAK